MRLRTRIVLASLCWLIPAAAQVNSAEPDASKQLSELGVNEILAEFDRRDVAVVDDLRSNEIAARAAQLLLSNDLASRGEYATMLRLAEAAEPAINSLPAGDKERLETLLSDFAANGDAAVFEQLQARVSLLNAAGKHDEVAVGAVKSWLATRDLSSLDVRQLAWLLSESLPRRSELKQFTAVWNGTITAPRSGKYEFSTTPINVNRVGLDAVKQTLTAKVGDVDVLRTPHDPPSADGGEAARRKMGPRVLQWEPNGTNVDLTANQPVPVRVEISFECSRPDATAMPSAILCWKGPGISRQPIGAEAFVSGEGTSGGLDAEYKWHENGETKLAHEKAVAVDFVWSNAGEIASAAPELVQQINDRLWSLATADEYLAKCESGEATHVYMQHPSLACHLSSAQRREFQELLISRPDLLERITELQISPLYRNFRFGSEDVAIDLLGAWMQRNPRPHTEIAFNFFDVNRRVYWELGRLLAMQQPEVLQRLQDDYLVAADDACVLPIAFILNYGYSIQNRSTPPAMESLNVTGGPPESQHSKWLSLLNEAAVNSSLDESSQIDWLLARAHFEEAQTTASASRASDILLAGTKWLQDAMKVAQTDESRARLARETIARLAASNNRRQLERFYQSLGESSSPTEMHAWKRSTDQILTQWERRQELDRRASERSYAARITKLRDEAEASGDQAEAVRYNQLLGGAVRE